MENIRRYFKRTDKTYLLLCIFSSVMAVTALSSWAAKQGNGFAVDEITGQITGLGDYRRAAVQAGARRAYVVNVSAMEGQFSRRYKGPGHPHTNMAKAAVNLVLS